MVLIPDKSSVLTFTFIAGSLEFDLLFSLDLDLEVINLNLSESFDEDLSVDPFSGGVEWLFTLDDNSTVFSVVATFCTPEVSLLDSCYVVVHVESEAMLFDHPKLFFINLSNFP